MNTNKPLTESAPVEPGWEYARMLPSGAVFTPVTSEDDDHSLPIVRRRKAGPWEQVTP